MKEPYFAPKIETRRGMSGQHIKDKNMVCSTPYQIYKTLGKTWGSHAADIAKACLQLSQISVIKTLSV